MEILKEVGLKVTSLPSKGFKPHKVVQKIYEARREAVSSPDGMVDWATAEMLAFATLLNEGFHVR